MRVRFAFLLMLLLFGAGRAPAQRPDSARAVRVDTITLADSGSADVARDSTASTGPSAECIFTRSVFTVTGGIVGFVTASLPAVFFALANSPAGVYGPFVAFTAAGAVLGYELGGRAPACRGREPPVRSPPD